MKNTTQPQTLRYSDPKHTVYLESDLRVAAVVMSTITESGLETIDFVLKAADGPFSITLIENPLLDYRHGMEQIDQMTARRKAFKEVYGQEAEPPDCSWKHILSLWSAIHWYRVDDFDTMTVGMSVAMWEGMNRNNTNITFE